MKRAALRWLCLSCLFLGPVQPAAHAQLPQVVFRQGSDAFRRVLYAFHLEPLADVDSLLVQPRQTLLIVLGNTETLQEIGSENLKRFIEQGGALLVATDHRTRGPLAAAFGVEITGADITADPE